MFTGTMEIAKPNNLKKTRLYKEEELPALKSQNTNSKTIKQQSAKGKYQIKSHKNMV